MRFSITSEFSQIEQNWRDAYAKHDAYAESGDDGVGTGGSQAADDASADEWKSLEALTRRPAVTTMEVRRKLKVITSERLSDLSLQDLEHEFDQIKLDMIQLGRPNASATRSKTITRISSSIFAKPLPPEGQRRARA